MFVNRLWKQHFGSGIVSSLDNFGTLGSPPSHPELLDWLAVEFVKRGWSIKEMHRLMMTSKAYQQQSTITDEHLRIDPDNRLVSRMPMRRLSAEEVRDSLLLTAGRLSTRPFGPPDAVEVRKDGLVTSKLNDGAWRRSVYVRQRRKEMPTLLETFDLPQMNPNCVARTSSDDCLTATVFIEQQNGVRTRAVFRGESRARVRCLPGCTRATSLADRLRARTAAGGSRSVCLSTATV